MRIERRQTMTNADRIRTMSDEELAKLIGQTSDCPCPAESTACTEEHESDEVPECWELILRWLKQEVEE